MTKTDTQENPEKRGRGRPKSSSDLKRREDGAARQRAYRLKRARERCILNHLMPGNVDARPKTVAFWKDILAAYAFEERNQVRFRQHDPDDGSYEHPETLPLGDFIDYVSAGGTYFEPEVQYLGRLDQK